MSKTPFFNDFTSTKKIQWRFKEIMYEWPLYDDITIVLSYSVNILTHGIQC